MLRLDLLFIGLGDQKIFTVKMLRLDLLFIGLGY